MKDKITVALDLDGVIWDLVRPWIEVYNILYDDNVTYDDIIEYDISKSLTKAPRDDVCKILGINGFWNLVEPFNNSIEYLSKLNEEYNLVIATKSDHRTLSIKLKRFFNLFPFMEYDQIICIHDKSLLNVDWLIDDCLDNLKSGIFNKIVLDAPYNRCDNELLRAKDLKEVYNIISNFYME